VALATPLAALAAAGACLGLIRAAGPAAFPPCPFLALTGCHCPGCGGLRAAYALAHGDLAGALAANAVAVAAAGVLAAAVLAWTARALGAPPRRAPAVPWWAPAAAVAAFTVLRNLPAGAFLAP
jgi:hypothetical protein